uniref:Reverse transcriptase domain-containing protein n=1 Tax=Tanacetum cinerariifolium TaxID=118510 RepID=A0A699H8Y8_TANCI|nr:reverse transcriptase domain-containing protein [Tanacetum cinerariifolium]
MRKLEGKWVMKKEMRMILKDVTVSKFTGYTSSKEEDEEEEKEETKKKGSNEASEIGSNSESSGYATSDNEVESDLESTVRSEPNPSNNENPDIAAIIAQQLQKILPQIVTQVTNNVNNVNANGRNSGGAVALTRWIEKMESVIENSGCVENQKVKYAASSFINKTLTWWNTQVQAKGREIAIGMSWVEFKALLVEEFYPSNEMEKLESKFWNHTMVGANHAGYTDRFHELAKLVPHLVTLKSKRIESDEAVRCGTLTRSSEKRNEVEETSKQGEGAPCRLCFNCQKLSHFARDCRAPVKQVAPVKLVAPVSTVRMGKNQRFCYECESSEHLYNTCPKLNRAPGQAGNLLALEGNRNTRNNRNQARERAFKVANGKKEEVDRIICDYKLELGNSQFTIDLIPLGHGSFDVIVGMDWLSKNKAEIVCHEKVVKIPLKGGEILRVQRERTLGGTKTLMRTRADELELSDIPVVDFTDVILKDLSGLPPQQQVK